MKRKFLDSKKKFVLDCQFLSDASVASIVHCCPLLTSLRMDYFFMILKDLKQLPLRELSLALKVGPLEQVVEFLIDSHDLQKLTFVMSYFCSRDLILWLHEHIADIRFVDMHNKSCHPLKIYEQTVDVTAWFCVALEKVKRVVRITEKQVVSILIE